MNKIIGPKEYKQSLSKDIPKIKKFLLEEKYKTIQNIVEFYFDSLNNQSTVTLAAFDADDRIIASDISNCFVKILYAIVDEWENKQDFIANQLNKIEKLVAYLGDGINLPYIKKQMEAAERARIKSRQEDARRMSDDIKQQQVSRGWKKKNGTR